MIKSGATCDFEVKLIDEMFEVFLSFYNVFLFSVEKALGDKVLVRSIGFFYVISSAAIVDYSWSVNAIDCWSVADTLRANF